MGTTATGCPAAQRSADFRRSQWDSRGGCPHVISYESDRRKISESAAAVSAWPGSSSHRGSLARNVIQRAHRGKSDRPSRERFGSICMREPVQSASKPSAAAQAWSILWNRPGAVRLIRKNLASLGIETGFQILKQDSLRALQVLAVRQILFFSILLTRWKKPTSSALEKLSTSSLLKDESIVIAEHQKKFEPGEIFGPLRRYRKLVQGDAALSFYRLAVD